MRTDLFPLPLLLALQAPAHAQAVPRLEISEILVDPVGADAGRQLIEVHNRGNVPIDLGGWFLLAEPTAAELPAVVIPIDGFALIHLGAPGRSTPEHVWLPGFRTLSRVETLALYRSARFADPGQMVDFVSFGGGTGRIDVAVQAGQWPAASATVALPAAEGHTIAHFGAHAYGSGDEPEAWYQDGTPTPGGASDAGSLFNLGIGCPKRRDVPWIGTARAEGRPWLGETWLLDVFNLPPTPGVATLIFGLQRLPVPHDLVGIGMPGCALHVSVDVLVPLPFAGADLVLPIVVPRDPTLVGAALFPQAFVPDPRAGNPAQALMSNPIVATVGSR